MFIKILTKFLLAPSHSLLGMLDFTDAESSLLSFGHEILPIDKSKEEGQLSVQ